MIILAALIGWLTWPCHLFPFSIIAPALIMRSPSRTTAALFAVAYYLAASTGVIHGAAVFFGQGGGSMIIGIVLWLGAAAINATPWAALWHRNSFLRSRTALALIILSVPPLGLVGWASPLTAAGDLFPGFVFAGLALTLWLIMSIADTDVTAVAIMLLAALAANYYFIDPSAGMQPINTHFGGVASGARDFSSDYKRNLAAISLTSKAKAAIIVLPETIAGTWTNATAALWKPVAIHSAGIIAVGTERLLRSNGYENGMVLMSRHGYRFFQQRVPVPVSMWRPWAKNGAKADWIGSGVAQFDGHRIGYLVCYEQLLVWPALVTAYHHPETVVGMANDWWARGTSAPGIQRMAIGAWSKLFGWTMVDAVNL